MIVLKSKSRIGLLHTVFIELNGIEWIPNKSNHNSFIFANNFFWLAELRLTGHAWPRQAKLRHTMDYIPLAQLEYLFLNRVRSCTSKRSCVPESYQCLCSIMRHELDFFLELLGPQSSSSRLVGLMRQAVRTLDWHPGERPDDQLEIRTSELFQYALFVNKPVISNRERLTSWPLAAGYSVFELFYDTGISLHKLLYVLDWTSGGSGASDGLSSHSVHYLSFWHALYEGSAWLTVTSRPYTLSCAKSYGRDHVSVEPRFSFAKYVLDRSQGSLQVLLRSAFQAFLFRVSNEWVAQSWSVPCLCDLVLDYWCVVSLELLDLLFMPLTLQAQYCVSDQQLMSRMEHQVES